MKISLSRRLAFLIALFLTSTPLVLAQDSDIKDLAETLAKTLVATGQHPSVAVVDFTDLQANVTPLGQYIAAELEDALVNAPYKLDVIDRSRLQVLIKEHKLASNGLIDPSTARALGKIAGVGVLITGTITPFGDTVRISVKALDSESARVEAAISKNIPKTPTIIELIKEGPNEAIIPAHQNAATPKPNSSVTGPDKSSSATGQVFESHNIRFEMNSCERSYTTVSCTLTITNLGEDGDIGFQTCNQYPARIQDDAGREYRANAITIGRNSVGKVCTWRSPSNPYTLVNDTRTRTTVHFEGVAQDTSSLSLFELWIQAGKEGSEQIRIAFHKIPLIQK